MPQFKKKKEKFQLHVLLGVRGAEAARSSTGWWGFGGAVGRWETSRRGVRVGQGWGPRAGHH